MTKIKPSGNLTHIKLYRAETTELSSSDTVRYWVRYLPQRGIAIVQCWSPSNPSQPSETRVEIVIGENHWSRWYYHGVSTNRHAALLVNRLLADIQEADTNKD